MAFPVILVNSATGSDSAASGAGPGTALTGTAASFSGATVTLDGSPNLSGVATDGSHVLYMVTSTGVRFFKITAVNDGADTVDVTPNPAGTSTGRTWAIGGKRASIGSATSKLLIDNGGGSGDAMPGWTIEMESGHTENLGAQLDFRRSGDTTSGRITLRGALSGTRPVITVNAATNAFAGRASYWDIYGFNLVSSHASANFGYDQIAGGNCRIQDLLIGGTGGGSFSPAVTRTGTGNQWLDCEIRDSRAAGISTMEASTAILACHIHDNVGNGITFNADPLSRPVIKWCLIEDNGGDGISFTASSTASNRGFSIAYNTIANNDGDGVEIATQGDFYGSSTFTNNLLTGNGNYGLRISAAGASAISVLAFGLNAQGNNTYNNTSGACNLSGVLQNDPGLDPQYADIGTFDFTPTNASLIGAGWPSQVGLQGPLNYPTPGAVSPEAGGGGSSGGLLLPIGFDGGISG